MENETKQITDILYSEEFDTALLNGAEICSEVSDTLKQRDKDNYAFFYDIMLTTNREVQDICDIRARNRTDAQKELLKKFKRDTRRQYKFVKDMLYLPEEEQFDDNGVSNTVPKKVAQLVEKLSTVAAILHYIGDRTLFDELEKVGITLCFKTLEERSEAFKNENIKKDIESVFDTSCSIQKNIDDSHKKIVDDIFVNNVPVQLQYAKNSNDGGLKTSDFSKLVKHKMKMMKAEQSDKDHIDKFNETVTNEAEKTIFTIQRNTLMRDAITNMEIKN